MKICLFRRDKYFINDLKVVLINLNEPLHVSRKRKKKQSACITEKFKVSFLFRDKKLHDPHPLSLS